MDMEGPVKKKRKTGARCIVHGCGNESHHGFFLHELPGKKPGPHEQFTPHQRAWIQFIGRKRVFDTKDARTYSKIFVCSGHFKPEDYDASHVQMYQLGFRKKAPALTKTAVPSKYDTEQPFPESWFIARSSGSALPTSMQATATSTTVTTASTTVTTASSTVTTASSTVTTASTSSMSDTPQSTGRRRTQSVYVRKKETAEIFAEYAKRAEEERMQDILNRSKAEQRIVQLTNHKVGTVPIHHRSCKVQVKPKVRKPATCSRGSQISTFNQVPTVPTVTLSDSATQTTESSFKEEEEEEEEPAEEPEDECEYDDEEKDPSYVPEASLDESADEERIDVTQPTDPLQEEKYIVFETNLLSLFKSCVRCHSSNVTAQKIRARSFGSQLKIKTTCHACQKVWEWDSQPRIGSMWAGNLLLSCAILFGGASPTKVLRVLGHFNLKVISNRTFMDHQRDFLQPAIIRVFQRHQRTLVRQTPEEERLVLGGDARADSPGHSAKYGAYSLMDMKRGKILDVQLVQSNEVSSSNAMEKEGLRRGLLKLTEMGLLVGTLVTDRHSGVAKWMRETYPDVEHRYDVWHIAKGILKKMTAISKLKDCEPALLWRKSVVNHVYWTASSTPDGNGDMMVAKFKSVFNHLIDVHQHETAIFPRCQHPEEYPQREWMREGSKVYVKLTDELLKTRLLNDLKKMSPLAQTSQVEAFHSVLLYWCPKMLAYSYEGMKCRLFLAALHWNENANRTQATKADGTLRFTMTYQKAKEGRPTVSKVLTACTFNYVEELMAETCRLVANKEKLRGTMPELEAKPALAAKYQGQRPDKEEAIRQAQDHHRFAKE